MTNRDIVYISLFAAIVIVLGLIPAIPLAFIPVPITARSLGLMLAGSLLGAKRGAWAMVLFLVLVAIGIPQASGGSGLGVFLGPRGGFLLAFPLAAGVIGWLTERFWQRLNVWNAFLFNVIGGIVVLYAIGVPWLALGTNWTVALSSIAFLPGDGIKAVIAALTAVTIKRTYPLIRE
ncbi:biotin transporter BioY [filamentous cyanobacterium CCP2]|nr:biotin transporter BioY [filamentous cyanobacterium CCP2]